MFVAYPRPVLRQPLQIDCIEFSSSSAPPSEKPYGVCILYQNPECVFQAWRHQVPEFAPQAANRKKFNVIFTNLSILQDATENYHIQKTMCACSPSSSALTLTQEQIDLLGVKKQIVNLYKYLLFVAKVFPSSNLCFIILDYLNNIALQSNK